MKRWTKKSSRGETAAGNTRANFIESNDLVTKRTVNRYRESLGQLKEALKLAQGQWKAFQFPEFESMSEDIDPVILRQAIDNIFQSNEGSVKNSSRWSKVKRVIEAIYTALSPFVKNVLVIARDSSGVHPTMLQSS